MTPKYKVWRHNGKIKVRIEYELPDDNGYTDKDEIHSRLAVSLPWMAKYLHTWADFDFIYTIDLFSDALQALGEGLIRWDNTLHAKKNGRRAIVAGEALKRAYNYCSWNKPNYKNWASRHTDYTKPVKGGHLWCHTYSIGNAMDMDPEEYSNKMFHIIVKKQQKEEKELKKEAWQYTIKNIEKFWD